LSVKQRYASGKELAVFLGKSPSGAERDHNKAADFSLCPAPGATAQLMVGFLFIVFAKKNFPILEIHKSPLTSLEKMWEL
jgi:hypothetical protein